jgi:hypothetical protein
MSRRPDAPTFFVDRDLGPRFFGAVSADSRFLVEFHDTHFSDPSTDDSDWLRLIAEKNWIGVTHDKKIRSNHRAIIAAHRSKVIIVVGNRSMADHATNFIATYPRIERFVRNRPGPYTAKLYHPTPADLMKLRPRGRIELWGSW